MQLFVVHCNSGWLLYSRWPCEYFIPNIFTCNPIKYITHKVVAIQASIYLNYGFIFSIQAYCYKIRLLANASFLNIQYALDYTHMYIEFKINEI